MPNYIDILIRASIAYIILFMLTRLMGKREISQMTFFDYTVGITIGSITAIMAIDRTKNFLYLTLGLFIFGLFQIVTSYLSLKNLTFRKIMNGTTTMLIKNGRVLENNLAKERLNIDELNARLREKNVFKLADVEFAFLEPDGKISVMKKSNKQPITPSDFRIPVEYTGIGSLVVEEGKIKEDRLKEYGLTKAWLMSKLAEQGIFDLSKVMFAQVDSSGKLYVDLYEEYANELSKDTSSQILLAKLHKIHADLLTYHHETQNNEMKKKYKELADKIQHITAQFHSYVNKQSQQNLIINHQFK